MLHRLTGPFSALVRPASDFCLIYLLAYGILALGLQIRRERRFSIAATLRFLFPAEIYRSRSAAIDMGLWALNLILVVSPLTAVAAVVGTSLAAAAGASPWPLAPGPAVSAAYTLAIFVCADLGVFLGHLFLHRSPMLWEFHKVHHSATVLMPFTAQRQHPVDWLVVGATTGLCVGLAGGFFDWLAPGGIDAFAILERNPGDFAFAALCLHFRHSHIRVDFGPLVDRLLISPAMHQLHHSSDPMHHDCNFGVVLSVWDHLLGTARPPPPAGDVIRYGLGGEENQFPTLSACYWRPFRQVAVGLTRRSKECASSRSGAPER